jgi:trehalose-6-phosphate synthase
MPIEERRERQDELFRVISENDIHSWGDHFLTELTGHKRTTPAAA